MLIKLTSIWCNSLHVYQGLSVTSGRTALIMTFQLERRGSDLTWSTYILFESVWRGTEFSNSGSFLLLRMGLLSESHTSFTSTVTALSPSEKSMLFFSSISMAFLHRFLGFVKLFIYGGAVLRSSWKDRRQGEKNLQMKNCRHGGGFMASHQVAHLGKSTLLWNNSWNKTGVLGWAITWLIESLLGMCKTLESISSTMNKRYLLFPPKTLSPGHFKADENKHIGFICSFLLHLTATKVIW